MTKEESKRIVDKIRVYRQRYDVDANVYEEWFKVLELYEYEDVDEELNNYLRNENNQGRIPDAYYLTKYLKTSSEKKDPVEFKIICPECLKSIRRLDYDAHRSRCQSTLWMIEKAHQYLNQSFSYSKLMHLEKDKFDDFYYQLCKKIFPKMNDGLEKRILENVILTYEGKPAKLLGEAL